MFDTSTGGTGIGVGTYKEKKQYQSFTIDIPSFNL